MICNMNIGHKRETKEKKRELSTWHFCLIGLSSLMIGAKELFLSEIVAFNCRTWKKKDQLLVINEKNLWVGIL